MHDLYIRGKDTYTQLYLHVGTQISVSRDVAWDANGNRSHTHYMAYPQLIFVTCAFYYPHEPPMHGRGADGVDDGEITSPLWSRTLTTDARPGLASQTVELITSFHRRRIKTKGGDSKRVLREKNKHTSLPLLHRNLNMAQAFPREIFVIPFEGVGLVRC